MPDDTRYRDAEWLREQYVEKGLSISDIADLVNGSNHTIHTWLSEHGIERRSVSEGVRRSCGNDPNDTRYQDADWLQKQVEAGLTQDEIADKAETSLATVSRWMDRHDIEPRGHATGPDHHMWEERPPKEELKKAYIDDQRPRYTIAREHGVSSKTVKKWLKEYDIDIRSVKEATPSGPDSVFWNGGGEHPYYYGPDWMEQRQKALERDGYECQGCGVTNETHIETEGHGLHVHHIERFLSFDDHEDANQLDNLVTLCRDCHSGKWEPMSPLRPQTAD